MMRMAVVALFTLTAGTALGEVVCEKKSGAMFLRAACKPHETQVDMSGIGAVGARGPQGTQGAVGPTGPQGLAGTSATGLWAVVNSDGTLARGSSAATGASQLQTGTYEVDFNQDVTGCAYVATIGDPRSIVIPPAGSVSVTGRYNNPNGLYIVTYDSSGAAADRALFVTVFCN
jgi:hypothetical protein